jgi:hypothetical protein
LSFRVGCAEDISDTDPAVCVHLVQSLDDGEPRGFLWNIDEYGQYLALCEQCNALTDEQWERDHGDIMRIVCFVCFSKAGRLNGVTLPGIH